jgi:hypothetical protein
MQGTEYHKIHTVFKRDMTGERGPKGRLIDGVWARDEFDMLAEAQWQGHEKLDGTSLRIIVPGEANEHHDTPDLLAHADMTSGERLLLGGRTARAQIPTNLLDGVNEQIFTPLEERIKEQFASGAVLYGEGVGPKIQKGGERYATDKTSTGCQFVLFDVRIGRIWLKPEAVEEIGYALGIPVAQEMFRGTLTEAIAEVQNHRHKYSLIHNASAFGDFTPEGWVMRPRLGMLDRMGRRLITKLKCADWPQ